MSATRTTTKWNDHWLSEHDNNEMLISAWCKKESECEALCRIDKKKINFSNNGLKALKSHSSSTTHRKAASAISSMKQITNFALVTTSASISSNSIAEKANEAEIRWTLHVVENNYSFKSNHHCVEVFQKMHPDSKIAEVMTLKEGKIAYMIKDAIFPYLQQQLSDVLKDTWYTLHIDEANKCGLHLGIVIRYMKEDDWNVHVQSLDLPALSSTTAESIFHTLLETLKQIGIPQSKILCIMSDNCNTMRGWKSGVLIRVQEALAHKLVDIGGCSLHHMHNAARASLDSVHLISLDDIISEIFAFFRYHTHDKEYEVITSLMEVENHKFLRHVPTRWLQCLHVIQRIVEQFPALVVFFDNFARNNPNNIKAKQIKEKLDNPFTLCMLQFLSHALKFLDDFEKTFQSNGCHIHILWTNMNSLLRKWLLNFVEEKKVKKKKPALTDYRHNVLTDAMLLIGQKTRSTVCLLTEEQRIEFYDQVREFFLLATEKIIQYLPFDNVVLRNLRFMQPSSKSSGKLEKWILSVAQAMPAIVSPEEYDSLRLEVRDYKSSKISVDSALPVNEYWQESLKIVECPILSKLIRACLILPHGNAEVERIFSMLTDILVKKRQSLDQNSVRALTFIKSDMAAKKVSCFDFPITASLLKYTKNAKQVYKERLEEEKKQKLRDAEEEKLKRQRAAIEEERAKSSRLLEINESISEIDEKVAASNASFKLAMELEEKAKKLKENALETQRSELKKKSDMIIEQQRVEKRIAERVMTQSTWANFTIPKKKKK